MNHDGVTEKGIDSTFHAVTQHIFRENLINRIRRGGLNFYALWSHFRKTLTISKPYHSNISINVLASLSDPSP